MIALLFLIAVVFALALVFSWLAENPGTLTLEWEWLGSQISVGLITAIAALVIFVAVVMLAWWIIKGITRAPGAIVDHRRGRARDKGYRALSQGMLALAAGDVAQARACARQADRRLGHTREPMVLLLEAQTALADDKSDEARGLFDEMLEEQETRPLGLRGLFLAAQREGEHEAARHYAERAFALSPNHAWASDATLEYAAIEGDFDRVLEIVDDQQRTKTIDKPAAQRKRAVALAAKALTEVDADPAAARDHAKEAHRLDPSLVPAALAEARADIRLGETKRASKVLEETWRREPHPDLAEAYMNVVPGASGADRLKRARALEALKPDHIESLLATGHAALDAHELDTARRKAHSALEKDPREGVYLLLADIEEAQSGNAGRVRELLQAAVRAPRDPAWVADGIVSRQWAPVSPVTGRYDAFEWKQPTRPIGSSAIESQVIPDGQSVADLSSSDTKPDVSDAEIVEVQPVVSNRVASDANRGRMVAMDESGSATANGRGATVITGSGTTKVTPNDAASAERASAPRPAQRGSIAEAITTPPASERTEGKSSAATTSTRPGMTVSNGDDKDGADSLTTNAGRGSAGERPTPSRDPAPKDLHGIDLKSRTTTRPTDAGRAPAGPSSVQSAGAETSGNNDTLRNDADTAQPVTRNETASLRPSAPAPTIVPSGAAEGSSQPAANTGGGSQEKRFRQV